MEGGRGKLVGWSVGGLVGWGMGVLVHRWVDELVK